jgi:hypothetical protein
VAALVSPSHELAHFFLLDLPSTVDTRWYGQSKLLGKPS